MIKPKDVFLTLHRIKKEKFKNHNTPKVLSELDKAYLKSISINFDTVWHNINLEEFIKCGIEIHGFAFDLDKFFDKRVLDKYISRDKYKKWYKKSNIKDSFYESLNFVRRYSKKNGLSISEYCSYTENGRKVIIDHHVRDNDVCKYFIVHMYKVGMLKLTSDDWLLLPHIKDHYKQISDDLSILNGIKEIFE